MPASEGVTQPQQQQKRDFSEDADAPSPVDPSSDSNKKRRTTGASARGVANLTPDQLAKKRANDREAQRAIRERTKNQIENLEQKIRELTSQQPYQELQHVIRQKEQAEAENMEMKKRLNSVMSLIQPMVGQHAQDGQAMYNSPAQNYIPNRPGSSSNFNSTTPSGGASPGAGVGPAWQAPNASMGYGLGNYSLMLNAQAQLSKQKHEMAHNLEMGPERLGLEFLLDGNQKVNKILNGMNEYHDPSLQTPRGKETYSPRPYRSNSMSSHSGYPVPTQEMAGHAAPIRNGPPTCPLDNILLDFLHERQQQAADGMSTPKLVGPAYPSVSSLLNPSKAATSHPLSKVFTDILGIFPDLSTLPEKVAVLYIMFLVMRWQISPTQENYDRLPEWATPRPSQIFTPHPAWIDHLPFPKMRDRLVSDYNPRDYLFDNFFIPYTTTMSVNWPYEPTDTLLSSMESDDVIINPVFERHLRRLDNWSLGPAFAKAFPGLADTYRLKVDGDRK
ncbi:related to bZIP transcription factor [Rhynchosporium secalis]|uniref:Related to bZIP transcription factor n=1 Tax=Rhynchosporium secalis TaxID=38038 RepID=A0A1E1LZA9_RHYSE|nr:related to bZIP transcription factor [Rhynchosporium secalis]